MMEYSGLFKTQLIIQLQVIDDHFIVLLILDHYFSRFCIHLRTLYS